MFSFFIKFSVIWKLHSSCLINSFGAELVRIIGLWSKIHMPLKAFVIESISNNRHPKTQPIFKPGGAWYVMRDMSVSGDVVSF